MAYPEKVSVVVEMEDGVVFRSGSVYLNQDDAEAAAESLRMDASCTNQVVVLRFNFYADASEVDRLIVKTLLPNAKTKTKKAKVTQVATPESGDELERLGSDPKEKTPKVKRALTEKELEAKAARQKAPEGRARSLNGLKMTFIGTLTLEHVAYHTTTTNCGGEVSKKLEDADYVVVGKKPGPKKEEAMEKCGSKQISEDTFFTMIGGTKPTLKHAADDGVDGETPAKKQKKEKK